MSYLDRLSIVLAAWDLQVALDTDSDDPGHWEAWDAALAITVELYDAVGGVDTIKVYGKPWCDMSAAEKLQVAGESWDSDENYSMAAKLDSECCVCGGTMGDHDAAQQFSCDAVYASGDW